MKYQIHDHRSAQTLLENDSSLYPLFGEIKEAVGRITDDDLIAGYNGNQRENRKSLSETINDLLRRQLLACGWKEDVGIFSESWYKNRKRWSLDFCKGEVALEIAFNHDEAVAWNLMKPVLASEPSDVGKHVHTKAGVIICATKELVRVGNLDSAVGSFEKFKHFLKPLYNMLPTPILLMGLERPESFYIDKRSRQVVCM